MSTLITVPEAPFSPVHPAAPGATGRSPRTPPRTRRRFWLLLIVTAIVSLIVSPAPWRALLRVALTWEAQRHGAELTIGRIEGGPFDTFQLYAVRCRQSGAAVGGTDVRIARVGLTPDWSLLSEKQLGRTWMQRVTLDGVTGTCDLANSSVGPGAPVSTEVQKSWLSRNAVRFVPANFFIQSDDFLVTRGRYHLRARSLRLSGSRGAAGLLLARELEIGGPGFENTFLNRHSTTAWQGNRLTVTGMQFAPGIRLASAMLDGTQLGRRRLGWDGTLSVLDGDVRAQGAVDFSGARLGLELAGTLRQLPVQSAARLLGLVGSAGGLIEQGNFSFRGDLEDWSAGEMWLAAQATDFRWGRRQWQNLELQAVVLHRRVQVNRLELRQSRNQLSLKGEYPLPPPATDGKPAASRPWWEAGFSCKIDARLDDLRTLSSLLGPRFPDLNGRMSINGALDALPGRPGIDGYLNVEGSQLSVRGGPLDYLHSTLLFHGEEMQVADLQATHSGDYLAGKWTTRLVGAPAYSGELKISVKDRSAYASALDGILDLNKIGLGSDDPKAPVLLDGNFHGPGQQGEIVFQNTGNTTEPLRVPVPTVGDWWRDD